MTALEVLGKKHAIAVLLEIYDHSGLLQNEIADRGFEASEIWSAGLPELFDAGLIGSDRVLGSSPIIRYYITSGGERICHLLQETEGSERSGPLQLTDDLAEPGKTL